MPWGDGTGPWGFGPMTGRAAGYCAGYPMPGYANPAFPRWGWGRGRGRGRGRGWWGRGRGYRRMYWAAGPRGLGRFGYGTSWGWGAPAAWW
ncbi:MAG: DUF5320 domain-containing protein [Deltaproteobacteria bacterium]|nr:DUF5320 domain-containing protein [Deltaproteobacteria bacterium]